jgi:hypothetical protein
MIPISARPEARRLGMGGQAAKTRFAKAVQVVSFAQRPCYQFRRRCQRRNSYSGQQCSWVPSFRYVVMQALRKGKLKATLSSRIGGSSVSRRENRASITRPAG